MKVKNKKGTGDLTCKCDSWIDHWNTYSGGSLQIQCCVLGCTNLVDVGAHVIKQDSNDLKTYIVPFCHSCNQTEDTVFILNSGTKLASANVSDTCG